jgi:hypothetical protein
MVLDVAERWAMIMATWTLRLHCIDTIDFALIHYYDNLFSSVPLIFL